VITASTVLYGMVRVFQVEHRLGEFPVIGL
jgi:hypothetical protein